MIQNSMLVTSPYLINGTWVFDAPTVGLVKEPFVAGIPTMLYYIDHGTFFKLKIRDWDKFKPILMISINISVPEFV